MRKLLMLVAVAALVVLPSVGQTTPKKAPKLQITLDRGCDDEIWLYGLSLYTVSPDPKSCKPQNPADQKCDECTKTVRSKSYTITQEEWGKLHAQAIRFEKLAKNDYSQDSDGQLSSSIITVKRRDVPKKVVTYHAADAGSYDGAPASYKSIATQLEALRAKYIP